MNTITSEVAHLATQASYEAAFEQINAYLRQMQGDESKLTAAEHKHFREIALAIQRYEQQHYLRPTRQELLVRNFAIGEWDAERLRAFRQDFSLTQPNLSELLGIPQRRLAEMERGNRIFSKTIRIALDRVAHYIRQQLEG